MHTLAFNYIFSSVILFHVAMHKTIAYNTEKVGAQIILHGKAVRCFKLTVSMAALRFLSLLSKPGSRRTSKIRLYVW